MILVVGGKGLVGKALVQELGNIGRQYKVADMPEDDIRQIPSCLNFMKGADVVVNCAAISHIPYANNHPRHAFSVNVSGIVNLLETAHYYKIKHFIHLSTCSVYGNFQGVEVNETCPVNPQGIYACTKASSEHMVNAFHKLYNLPTTIIRTSSVYGDGDPHPRVVKNFILNALSGEPLIVEGAGDKKRDFTYVKDLARGIVLTIMAGEKTHGQTLNITGGTDVSILDLANKIKELIPQTRVELAYQRNGEDTKRGRVDNSKAKELIGYQPKYSLEQGLKEIIQCQ